MGTRVTGVGSTAWFVRESVDEVKALIDPPVKNLGKVAGARDDVMVATMPPRFVDLTRVENRAGAKVAIVVAHIIALEPYDG